MKRQIDLEKAAEAETFGALAVRHGHVPVSGAFVPPMTDAQRRCLSDLARSMVRLAKEAGAGEKLVVVGDVSFELHGSGSDEVLFVRTAASRSR